MIIVQSIISSPYGDAGLFAAGTRTIGAEHRYTVFAWGHPSWRYDPLDFRHTKDNYQPFYLEIL